MRFTLNDRNLSLFFNHGLSCRSWSLHLVLTPSTLLEPHALAYRKCEKFNYKTLMMHTCMLHGIATATSSYPPSPSLLLCTLFNKYCSLFFHPTLKLKTLSSLAKPSPQARREISLSAQSRLILATVLLMNLYKTG